MSSAHEPVEGPDEQDIPVAGDVDEDLEDDGDEEPASEESDEPEADDDDDDDDDGEVDANEDIEQSDFGPPFEARSFGGEFVWADAASYTCKILRVRAGEKVLVSTRGRRDMVVMLTGGRAVLEVLEREGEGVDRVEMLPAAPVHVHPEREHRLVALTEVEMFTVYSRIE